MFTLRVRFKLNISDLDVHNLLTDINGIEPTQWFITENVGKNKKDVFAYILNNTSEYIQIIPIKGNKKKHHIDTENIAIYYKNTDIQKVSVIYGDINFYAIKIKLCNKTKFVMASYPWSDNEFHKWSMKEFKKEYKKSSKGSQIKSIITNILIISLLFVCLFSLHSVSKKIVNRYILAKYIQNTIESGEYKDELSVILKPYDKQNLQLDGSCTTIEAGNFKFNLPESYEKYVNPDYGYEESTLITYDCKVDEGIKRVIVDTEALDGGAFTDFDETLGDACEKEFGFRIDSQYNWDKLMWSIDYYNGDINYFDPEELVLYYSMLSTKANFVGAVTEVFEVETTTYKGMIFVTENSFNNTLIIMLDAYAHNDLNTSYRISTIVPQTDIDEAYKILNSVELITE